MSIQKSVLRHSHLMSHLGHAGLRYDRKIHRIAGFRIARVETELEKILADLRYERKISLIAGFRIARIGTELEAIVMIRNFDDLYLGNGSSAKRKEITR